MIFNEKKKYFRKKLDGVKKMVWDLEFKREKTRTIREEIRQEYDKGRAQLTILEAQIKSQKEKPTMEKGEIARLDDRETLLKRDVERFKMQIDGLDAEVNGAAPTEQVREGVQGINQQIDALRELDEMLKDYVRKL
jgi:chromosome segregation ATPase